MFNSDKAIESSKDDVLGRKGVAEALGEAIIKDTNKDSHVIAIYGKWGSGKTSFIKMALEHIRENTNNWEDYKKPIIVEFNPWIFSNQNELIGLFFKQLTDTLGKKDNSAVLKNVAEALRTYTKMVIPLSLVPAFTVPVLATSTATAMCSEAAESIGNYLEKDLEETKMDICESLIKIERRIIIVIDDIDRLNENEIRQTFQLVKSVADFPYTTYLLSFDREIVSKTLESEQNGYGKQYLEKIIQIPFELPEPSKLGFESKLNYELKKVINSSPHDDFDRVYWEQIETNLKKFFANMRDINRFANVLSFNYELVKEEVNVIDFIAITAIQVFLPNAYTEIKENKSVIVGIMSNGDSYRKEIDKLILDNIISKCDDNYKSFFQAFLTDLFPRVASFYSNTMHGSQYLQSWKKHRRICNEDSFDVYFRLSLPEGKVSQFELNAFLSPEMNTAAKMHDAFKIINDTSKILHLLNIFPAHAEKMPRENIEPFICMILDVSDSLPKDNSIFYGTPMRIHWIISSLLKQIETQDERFNVLKTAIQNSNQSLYTISWLLDFQDDLHGKYGYEASTTDESKQLINSEQLQELEQLICPKISKWAENGKLAKSSHMYTILILWERWDNGDKHQETINDIVSNNASFSKLILSMMSPRVSSSTTTWTINIDCLKELTGINDIKERIIKIKESSDYDKLSNNEKCALKICLESL